MKRRHKIILAVALLGGFAFFLLIRSQKADSDAPRYVPVQAQPTGPFGSQYCDWGGAAPFHASKVWIGTYLNRSSQHFFLYDLDERKILGELFNGGAVFLNGDQTKLLCGGTAAPVTSISQKIAGYLNHIVRGKSFIKTNMVETFWILDLKNNSARRIGELSQIPGTGSRWAPAPGFRYGYNVPNNTNDEGFAFFLADLDKEKFERIKFNGSVRGWWNEHSILIKDAANDYVLFDINSRETSSLFAAGTVADALKAAEIPDDPASANTFTKWNGHDYDFYFTMMPAKWNAGESFLFKVERSGPALKLVTRKFKFGYLGVFDGADANYVYNGENGPTGRGGNGSIILRDLSNNTERVLVPPAIASQYALPRFHRDSIIYTRDRVLWRIDLNGSNNVRVLPHTDDGSTNH